MPQKDYLPYGRLGFPNFNGITMKQPYIPTGYEFDDLAQQIVLLNKLVHRLTLAMEKILQHNGTPIIQQDPPFTPIGVVVSSPQLVEEKTNGFDITKLLKEHGIDPDEDIEYISKRPKIEEESKPFSFKPVVDYTNLKKEEKKGMSVCALCPDCQSNQHFGCKKKEERVTGAWTVMPDDWDVPDQLKHLIQDPPPFSFMNK